MEFVPGKHGARMAVFQRLQLHYRRILVARDGDGWCIEFDLGFDHLYHGPVGQDGACARSHAMKFIVWKCVS